MACGLYGRGLYIPLSGCSVGRAFETVTNCHMLKGKKMKYTIDELERDMDERQKREKAVRKDRGSRYGKPDDTLKNVRRGGWMGIVLSMNECMERMWTMYDNKIEHNIDPDPDDMDNSVTDIRNFSAYAPILLKGENKKDVTIRDEPPTNTPQVKSWEDIKKENVKAEVDKLGEMLK